MAATKPALPWYTEPTQPLVHAAVGAVQSQEQACGEHGGESSVMALADDGERESLSSSLLAMLRPPHCLAVLCVK